jgi:hypothetical protein
MGPLVVATTTWNSIDLIEAFLTHYRRMGFVRAIVMDFASDDGTRDVLTASRWRDFVTLAPFPGLQRLDSSNILLAVARDAHPHHGCLFCDPDELLVTPEMRLEVFDRIGEDVAVLGIPRFNMTASLSVADAWEPDVSHVAALTLRVTRRIERLPTPDLGAPLSPPWIFTAIHGKVLVDLDRTEAIGAGDHSARPISESSVHAPDGVYLLHYPFRSYPTFREKVERARQDFDANPHLPQAHGWQIRRWIRLLEAGRLVGEYRDQFIADPEVNRQLANGSLTVDDRVQRFHAG